MASDRKSRVCSLEWMPASQTIKPVLEIPPHSLQSHAASSVVPLVITGLNTPPHLALPKSKKAIK